MRVFLILIQQLVLTFCLQAHAEQKDFLTFDQLRDVMRVKKNLTPEQITELKLNPTQMKKLNLTPEQRTGIPLTSAQLAMVKLSPAQFRQLNLTKEQINNLGITEYASTEKSLSMEELTMQDFSDLELGEDQFEKMQLTEYQFSSLELSIEQFEMLQRSRKNKLNAAQFGTMELTREQLSSITLTETQILQIESMILRPVIKDLTSEHLERIQLSATQISRIKFNREQLGAVKLTKKQLGYLKIKSYLRLNSKNKKNGLIKLQRGQYKLNEQQLAQLSLNQEQLESIIFTAPQLIGIRQVYDEIIRTRRYSQLQQYLTPNTVSRLHLNPEQIASLELTGQQLLSMTYSIQQLEELDISQEEFSKAKEIVLKIKNGETSVEGLDETEKFVYEKVLDSLRGAPLRDDQLKELTLSTEQLSRLRLNTDQQDIVKDHYNLLMIKNALFNALQTPKGKEYEAIHLSPDQVRSLGLTSNQLLELELNSEQLEKVGLTNSDPRRLKEWKEATEQVFLEKYREEEKEFLKKIQYFEGLGQKLSKVAISSDQVNLSVLNNSQIRNIKLNSKQVNEVLYSSSVHDKKKINQSYLSYLENNINILDEEEVLSYRQKRQVGLTAEQLVDINYTEDQRLSVGLAKSELENFRTIMRNMIETGDKEIANKSLRLEFNETLLKLKKIDLTMEQFLRIKLTNIQLKKLTLTPSQVYRFIYLNNPGERGRINETVVGLVQEEKERIDKYLSTKPDERVEVNSKLLNYLREIGGGDTESKDFFSVQQINNVPINTSQIVKLDLTEKQLNERGVTPKGFRKLQELQQYYDEGRVIELSTRQKEKYELLRKRVMGVKLSVDQFFEIELTPAQLESVKFTQKQVNNILDAMGEDIAIDKGLNQLNSRSKFITLDHIILAEVKNRKRLIRGILKAIAGDPEKKGWLSQSKFRKFSILPYQVVQASMNEIQLGRAGVSTEEYEYLKGIFQKYRDLRNTDIPDSDQKKAMDIALKLTDVNLETEQILGLDLTDDQLANINFSEEILLRYLKSPAGKKELLELSAESLGYDSLADFLHELYTFEEEVSLNGLFVRALKSSLPVSLEQYQLNQIKFNVQQLSQMPFTDKEKSKASIIPGDMEKVKEYIQRYGPDGPVIQSTSSDIAQREVEIRNKLSQVILSDKQVNSIKLEESEYKRLELTPSQISYVLSMTKDIVILDKLNREYLNELRSLSEDDLQAISFPRDYLDTVRIRTEQLLKIPLTAKQRKDSKLTDEDLKILGELLPKRGDYSRGSPSYLKLERLENTLRSIPFSRKQILSVSHSSDQVKRLKVNEDNLMEFKNINENSATMQFVKNLYIRYHEDNFIYLNQDELLSRDQRAQLDISFANRLTIEYSDEQLSEISLSRDDIRTYKDKRKKSIVASDDLELRREYYKFKVLEAKLRKIPISNDHIRNTDFTLAQVKALKLNEQQVLDLVLKTDVSNELVLTKITDKLKYSNERKYKDFFFTSKQVEDMQLTERQLFDILITPVQLSVAGLTREELRKYKDWKKGVLVIENPVNQRDSTINEIVDIEKKILNVIITNDQLGQVNLTNIQKERLDLTIPQMWYVLQIAYQYDIGMEGDVSEIEKLAKISFAEQGKDLWSKRTYHTAKNFKNHKQSLINWEEIVPEAQLDLRDWKIDRKLKDKSPHWMNILRERTLTEMVGRFIDCIGNCEVFRGRGRFRAHSRSSVYEGDEIVNLKDSYSWIFMLDGSLVRLSPQSSITVNEINIGKKRIFFQIRVNWGNVLWLSRDQHFIQEKYKRETDTLFLPLNVRDANVGLAKKKYKEDDLFALVNNKQHFVNHLKKLNTLINDNNLQIKNKVTSVLFVMPNGNIYSDFPSLEMVVLSGNKSYVKSRMKPSGVQQFDNQDLKPVTYYFRGYQNKNSYPVDDGRWYEISRDGKNVDIYDGVLARALGINEKLTSHIPTILTAREIFLKRYSLHFFDETMTSERLAVDYGYRLWEDEFYGNKETDLQRRLKYLQTYTRRLETTTLKVAENFRARIKARTGEKVLYEEYGDHFYQRAIDDFALGGNSEKFFESDRKTLNSELKPFWQFINRKRKNSKDYLIYRN